MTKQRITQECKLTAASLMKSVGIYTKGEIPSKKQLRSAIRAGGVVGDWNEKVQVFTGSGPYDHYILKATLQSKMVLHDCYGKGKLPETSEAWHWLKKL